VTFPHHAPDRRGSDLVLNVRWLWLDFTDPRFGLTREQKRDIRDRARRLRFFRRPVFNGGSSPPSLAQYSRMRHRTLAGRVGERLPYLGLYLTWAAYVTLLPLLFADRQFIPAAALALMAGLVLWMVSCWTGALLARRWYRYAMHDLGYEICGECGYPLFGLAASTHCPECGWRRTRRDDPPPVAWTEADRAVLRKHGYEACMMCGGLLLSRDATCSRCGEQRPND
jgi:hypothetical protein